MGTADREGAMGNSRGVRRGWFLILLTVLALMAPAAAPRHAGAA